MTCPITIRTREVLKSVSCFCCDCGREIKKNELATEIIQFYDCYESKVQSIYSCCKKPHEIDTSNPKLVFRGYDNVL
jgi:hypothetical protein